MLGIKPMHLIHDWLYEELEEAKKYQDGKDYPKPKFVLLHTEDINRKGINSSEHGVFIFDTLEEAREEKKNAEDN